MQNIALSQAATRTHSLTPIRNRALSPSSIRAPATASIRVARANISTGLRASILHRLASPHLASPCLALPCLALPCLTLRLCIIGTNMNSTVFLGYRWGRGKFLAGLQVGTWLCCKDGDMSWDSSHNPGPRRCIMLSVAGCGDEWVY
ncbi:hypothetical protein E2C01_072873 [Portunus trituberculatus]|uniref:Uncharacterized protein n=1 Tax=Portunus trituberculatus TaxID=210409 RepID=A0A5B7IBU5_PORTR|nr:hypothetical protein [Portunus trituberculatus]